MFSGKKGFTLIELLVVVSIISLLTSVVLSSLNSARGKARDAKRLSELKQLANALYLAADANGGVYPSDGGSAKCLGTTGTCWNGNFSGDAALNSAISQFISSIPADPSSASRATKGDRYVYSDSSSNIAQFCNGGLPYPPGPFLFWIPESTTNPATVADCKNIGYPGCCGNKFTCAVNNACVYPLSR